MRRVGLAALAIFVGPAPLLGVIVPLHDEPGEDQWSVMPHACCDEFT